MRALSCQFRAHWAKIGTTQRRDHEETVMTDTSIETGSKDDPLVLRTPRGRRNT
ncbi:hypothetical protein CLE01_21640 [Cryobacterium levicorallinum]|nr:hypothetical protein CLE01_21640 [Cryobacterium levicorallinum]